MDTEQIAEIKGYLSGFISSGIESEGHLWLEVLEGGLQFFDFDVSTQRSTLIDLYKQVSEDFQHENLGLKQTIFEKSLSLDLRAYALKKWCHGFLAGLRKTGLPMRELQNDIPMTEKIRYIEGISQIEMDKLDISASDEVMFANVIEYLEKAVIQIYRVLNHVKPKH
jgi:uncharacterized protein YgfB (UPF0149 family)